MDHDEVHFKMSKKIAQLTKVIYHLNTRNDDSDLHVQSLHDAHEQEIQFITDQASRKLRDAVQRAQDNARAELQTALDRNKSHYDTELRTLKRDAEALKATLQLREKQLCEDWESRVRKAEQKIASMRDLATQVSDRVQNRESQLESMKLEEVKKLEEKYNSQVATLENKYTEQLREEGSAREQLSQEVKDNAAAWDGYKATQEKKLQILESEKQLLEKQIADLEGSSLKETGELQHQLHETEAKLQQQSAAAVELAEQLAAANQACDRATANLEKERQMQRAELEEAKTQMQRQIQITLSRGEESKGKLQENLQAVEEEKAALEKEVAEKGEKISRMTTQVEALVGQSKKSNERNDELQRRIDEMSSLNDIEVNRVRKEHEDYLTSLNKKHALQLEKAAEQHEFDIKEWEAKLAVAKDEAKHFQERMDSLDAAHGKTQSDLSDSHAAELKALREQLQAQHDTALAEELDALREQLATEKESGVGEWKLKYEHATSEFNKVRLEMDDRHQEVEIMKLDVERSRQRVETITAEHEAKQAQLQDQHDRAMASLQDEHTAAIAQALDEVKTAHAKELKELMSQAKNSDIAEAKIEALQNKIGIQEKKYAELQDKLQSDSNDWKAKLQQKEELVASLQQQNLISKDEADNERQRDLDVQAQQFENTKRELAEEQRQALAAQAESLAAEHSRATADLEQRHEARLQAASGEAGAYAEQLKQELQAVSHKKDDEIAKWKRELEEEKESNKRTEASLKKDLETRLEQAELRFRQQLHDEKQALQDEQQLVLSEAKATAEAAAEAQLAEAKKETDMILQERNQIAKSLEEESKKSEQKAAQVDRLVEEKMIVERERDTAQERLSSTTKKLDEERDLRTKIEGQWDADVQQQKHDHEQEIERLQNDNQLQTQDLIEKQLAETEQLKDEFDAARQLSDQQMEMLQEELARVQQAFDSRPSRQDDIEKIQALEENLIARDDYLQKQDSELRQARMELANREQNYNSTFAASGGASVNVGVLDPLAKRHSQGGGRSLPIAGAGSLQPGKMPNSVILTNPSGAAGPRGAGPQPLQSGLIPVNQSTPQGARDRSRTQPSGHTQGRVPRPGSGRGPLYA